MIQQRCCLLQSVSVHTSECKDKYPNRLCVVWFFYSVPIFFLIHNTCMYTYYFAVMIANITFFLLCNRWFCGRGYVNEPRKYVRYIGVRSARHNYMSFQLIISAEMFWVGCVQNLRFFFPIFFLFFVFQEMAINRGVFHK